MASAGNEQLKGPLRCACGDGGGGCYVHYYFLHLLFSLLFHAQNIMQRATLTQTVLQDYLKGLAAQ